MIFNLVQYLRNNFSNERIYPLEQYRLENEGDIPDRRILVAETGGTPGYIIGSNTYQIRCRDIDVYNARDLAFDFYDFLHGTDGRKGRFGVELPAVTIGAQTYSEKKTKHIEAIQKPEGIGLDQNGRSEYIFNIQIFD
jgi:hypothetical protein